jgi:carbonic anhydrase/acetyltransferase-like protein (isoleucine patch superfamily)
MKEEDEKKPPSLLGSKGPVKIGLGQMGEKHLLTTIGKPGYTQGVPYEETKYVSNVIGENYAVPTSSPEAVRSGATMPHMGVKAEVPAHELAPVLQPDTRRMDIRQGRMTPAIDGSAVVAHSAVVRGNVTVEPGVHIAEGAIVSAFEEESVLLCSGCAIFEGAIITVLPVRAEGAKNASRLVNVGGIEYPVYVGEGSVIASGAKLTGPCYIGRGCLVGEGAQVFWAKIGDGVIIEPGAFVMNVELPAGYFVPAGMRLTTKDNIEKLPKVTQRYRFRTLVEEMLNNIKRRS